MNDNMYGHIMETPQKVIRVEVQPEKKNVDGEFSAQFLYSIRKQTDYLNR